MNYLFALAFLLIVSFPISAQYVVQGTIKDHKGDPLEYANILLLQTADSAFVKGVVSDASGAFVLEHSNQGSYFLSISMLGAQPFESPVFTLTENRNPAPFAITLREDVATLEAATVTAKKPLYEQKIDRTVINVKNSVTASGSTALQILERSPGVQVDRMNDQINLQGKQGVVILFNGKRQRMEMDAVIQLLQSMPSDNLEKIELITTPPASFDAEGNAGVINIVTIKTTADGVQGNLAINGSYGERPKYGGSINLNIRKKWLNIFSDFSGNWDYSQHYVHIFRKNIFGNQITTATINSDRPAFTKSFNGRIGMDIYASEQTVFGVLVSGNYRYWDLDAHTNTAIQDNINGFILNDLGVKELNIMEHGMANINFRHHFADKSKISFDVDYLHYLGQNPVNYTEQNLNEDGLILNYRNSKTTKHTPLNFKVVKVDYSKKWSDKLSMEAGIKGTISTFENDLSLSHEVDGNIQFDPKFTDVGHMDEKIGAAYVSTDYVFNERWSGKAGLRYEYYDSALNSKNEGLLVDRKFGRLFPSLFFTNQINENEQWQFSYAERITRPSFNELAPIFFFFGYNTVATGNPEIAPTISRQLSTAYRFKNVLFNLTFSATKDALTYQPEIIAAENLFIIKSANLQDAKNASFSINAPWEITDWWESRYSLTGYWSRLQPLYEGKLITETNFSFSANTTQNFNFAKDFSLELTVGVNAPRNWGIGTTDWNGALNLGLQKSFSAHLKISAHWNNILDLGNIWIFKMDQPELDIDYSWRYQLEGNLIGLNLSWNFGNNKVKKATTRQTGSVEERQRMN